MTIISPTASARQASPIGVRPYSAIPVELLRDPRLTSTDKVLAGAIIAYAMGGKSTCWPSAARLAADIGKSVRTVRYGLRRLAATGWIESRPCSDNATGRILVLLWRLGAAAPPATKRPAPVAGESKREESSKKGPSAGDKPDGTGSPPPARPEHRPAVRPAPEPPEPLVTAEVRAWLARAPHDPMHRAAVRRFALAGLPLPGVSKDADSAALLPDVTPPAPLAFTAARAPLAESARGHRPRL